jgi:magnesium-transporting ATPase (P-type)
LRGSEAIGYWHAALTQNFPSRRYTFNICKEETMDEAKTTEISAGLTSAEAERLLQEFGRNELEEKKKPKVFLNEHSYIVTLFIVQLHFHILHMSILPIKLTYR